MALSNSFVPANASGLDGLAIGDFNHDGKIDIVVSGQVSFFGNPSLDVYLATLAGNGDGTFGTAHLIYTGGAINGAVGRGIVVTDMNGDGNNDILFSELDMGRPEIQPLSNTLTLLLGLGDGTFPRHQSVTTPMSSLRPMQPVLGDFNGDGYPDVALLDTIFLVTPSGNLVIARSIPCPADPVAAGDLNGDGKADLLTSGSVVGSFDTVSQTTPIPTYFASVQPSAATASGGQSAQFTITITPSDGFSSGVSLSATGGSAGTVLQLQPAILPAASGTSILRATSPANTPPGSYPITISATAGGITIVGGVTLNVGPPGTSFADFTGTVTPSSQSVVAGQTTTVSYTIQVAAIQNFDNQIVFSVFGVPPGASASFSPPDTDVITGFSILSVTTTAATPPGNYTLTVTGSSGAISHSRPVSLIVAAPAQGASTALP